MKTISLLGSTGSIGKTVLKIVAMFPERFAVKALAAKENVRTLADQILRFQPDMAVVFDEPRADELRRLVRGQTRTNILYGDSGYREAATLSQAEIVISAMVGAAGLMPTIAAIDARKTIALANKETLVMAGEIVMQRAKQNGVAILPVDSEHSAIFQCLSGHRTQDVDGLILTASGGPFLNRPAHEFNHIQPEDALKHPTWQMGKKITIDSATLMNKGLEVIEARHLFDMPHDRITVVIHPQSIIHSMVSFKDGSVIAQLGIPDMKGAIAYALSYPERLDLQQPIPDFAAIGSLTFQKPDMERFPCLKLAYQACEIGGTLPAVMNAANEIAVEAFLNRQIGFTEIPVMIQKTMNSHKIVPHPQLSDILEADQWARHSSSNTERHGRSVGQI